MCVHVCLCASSCLDGLGAAQDVREGFFTPSIAASPERIEKPSPSRTLICDNMSCWEQFVFHILSFTPCERLARRTHAHQHHAEHRAWPNGTALPNQRLCTFSQLLHWEIIETGPNRSNQILLPSSEVPHRTSFSHFSSAQIADSELKWRYRPIRNVTYGGVYLC